MKRCPECRRDYYDDSLLYCLDDGSALLEGPAIADTPTAILPEKIGSESETAHQVLTTDRPALSQLTINGPVAGRRRSRIPVLVGAVLVVLLLAGGALFAAYTFYARTTPATSSFQQMKITKLTDTGKAGNVAISPDGKYVVHSQVDGATQSLWIRHVATDSNVQIIPPAAVFYWRMTFSQDGNFVYYWRWENSERSALYRIPVLGGEPVKILSDIASGITFSPDGKQVAFMREFVGHVDSAIMIANADGSGQRELVHRQPPDDSFFHSELAWSPDGKKIVCGLASPDERTVLAEASVADGSLKPISDQRWLEIGRLAWLPDGSGLIATAKPKGSSNGQIYQFAYPSGEARRITNDTNNYEDLTLSGDGRSLVTLQKVAESNVWVLPFPKPGSQVGDAQARQLTTDGDRQNGAEGLAVTADGKAIFTKSSNGRRALWSTKADGSERKQLAEEQWLGEQSVSSDGKTIVMSVVGENDPGEVLCRLNSDGTGVTKLTGGDSEAPSITSDGQSVIYVSYDGNKAKVLKIPLGGGDPVLVFDGHVNQPQASPDGKWVMGWYRANESDPFNLVYFPFAGDDHPIKEIAQLDNADLNAWTPDAKSVAFTGDEDRQMNVWSVPLAGGKPVQLTNFKSLSIKSIAISAGGNWLALSRGSETNDVVMISNFR